LELFKKKTQNKTQNKNKTSETHKSIIFSERVKVATKCSCSLGLRLISFLVSDNPCSA